MGETLTISATVVLVVAIISGSILYGCSAADQRYWDTVKACTDSGGTWVPQWSAGTCVRAK